MICLCGVARPDDVRLVLALQFVFETEGALQWLIT